MNRQFTLSIFACLSVVLAGRAGSALAQSDDDLRIEERYVKQWGQQLEERAATLGVTTVEQYQKDQRDAKLDEGRSDKKIGLVVLTENGFGGSDSAYFLDGKLVCLELDHSLFIFKTPTLATSLAKSVDETPKTGMYVKGVAMTKPEEGKAPESDAYFFKKYAIKRGTETTSVRTVVEFRTLKDTGKAFRTAQIRLWDEAGADAIKKQLGEDK